MSATHKLIVSAKSSEYFSNKNAPILNKIASRKPLEISAVTININQWTMPETIDCGIISPKRAGLFAKKIIALATDLIKPQKTLKNVIKSLLNEIDFMPVKAVANKPYSRAAT